MVVEACFGGAGVLAGGDCGAGEGTGATAGVAAGCTSRVLTAGAFVTGASAAACGRTEAALSLVAVPGAPEGAGAACAESAAAGEAVRPRSNGRSIAPKRCA